MISTSAAAEALAEEEIPVRGLAVVGAVEETVSACSFIRCYDDIVRIDWGAETPDKRTIIRAMEIIGHYCDPVVTEFELLR